MSEISIKQGEGKWISISVTRSGVALDLSSASGETDLVFGVKEEIDSTAYLLLKSGESFDKTGAATGEIRLNIGASETTALNEGQYFGELKIVLTPEFDVDKSTIIPFEILPSVIDI
jgi:hypothetical protein